MKNTAGAFGPRYREHGRAIQISSTQLADGFDPAMQDYFRQDDGYSPRTIFSILGRRKKIIFGCIFLVTTAATVTAFILPKSFVADAMVVLDTRQSQIVAQPAVQANLVSGSLADPAIVKSEVALLSSQSYARKVIEHLDLLHNPIFQRENAPNPWISKVTTFIRQTAASLFGASDAVGPDTEMGKAINALRRELVVFNDQRSYAIQIHYSSGSAEFAALVANALAKLYISEEVENRANVAQHAANFLTARLGTLEAKARESERKVAEFERVNHIETVLNGNSTEQRVHELTMQLLTAAADLARKNAELKQVQDLSKSPDGALTAAQVLNSPVIQKLREQQAEIAARTASLRGTYNSSYPGGEPRLKEIDGMIANEARRVVLGIAADVSAAQRRYEMLQSAMSDEQAKLDTINKARVTLVQLQHEAAANRTLYDTFLVRSEQIEADEQSLQIGARVVLAEVPVIPSYPNKGLFVGFGFFGSLVMGMFLAFLVERLDEAIRTPEHASRVAGLPTLGIVPRVRSGNKALDAITSAPLSAYSDAIHNLLVSLNSAESTRLQGVVVLSSAVPKEGKSVVAAAMARGAAMKGARTLLVDFDLRHPSIGALFGHRSSGVLTRMYTEKSTDIARFARRDDASGVDYLSANRMTTNLQSMLGSDWVADLIARARLDYDLVVIDTPPLLTVSDALQISKLSDMLLLVVRWGRTPGSLVSETVRRLRQQGQPPTGIVLSMVDMRKYLQHRSGGYYYGGPDGHQLTASNTY